MNEQDEAVCGRPSVKLRELFGDPIVRPRVERAPVQCLLFFAASFLIVRACALPAADGDQPRISLEKVLDLRGDGINVFAFSSTSRELFVSHPVACTKLDQWNIAEKRLLHTYLCPRRHLFWDRAAVSPDGKLLIASTCPTNGAKCKVFFIDTQTHGIRSITEYDYPLRRINFDHSGKFVWIAGNPGPDPFVYDHDGKKHTEFDPKEFEAESKDRLWDVPARDLPGSPTRRPFGLFFRDANGIVHHLIDDSVGLYYALTRDGNYIGTSAFDQRVRIWRTVDLKEVFNEKIGAYPVELFYDSKENQFLVVDGIDGNTSLRAIKLPREDVKGQPNGPANGSLPVAH